MKLLFLGLILGAVLGAGSLMVLSYARTGTNMDLPPKPEPKQELEPGQVRVDELHGMENYAVLFGRGKGAKLSVYRYAGGPVDFSIELDGKTEVDPAKAAPVNVKNITDLVGYYGWLRLDQGLRHERWLFGNQTFVVPTTLVQTLPPLSLFQATFPEEAPGNDEGGGFGEGVSELFTKPVSEGFKTRTDPVEAEGTPFPFPQDRPVVLKAFDLSHIDNEGKVFEKHRLRLLAQVVSREEMQKRFDKAEKK